MEKSEGMGMRTFDSALYHLYQEGKISLDEALKNADAPNNLRLRIELHEKGQDAEQTFSGLSIVEEPDEEEEDEDEVNNEPPPIFAPPVMDGSAGK
jgi:twitching motility protein PilU